MKHDRLTMLAALNIVKPALAAKDLVEELTHVWFDDGTVTAYNDADLGIRAPFESPFRGGIRGALVLGLLQNSRAKEVIFEETGDEGAVLLKAARAKARLSVLDIARVVYEIPTQSKESFPFTEDLVSALKEVLVSVGNDTSIPEKMGVTITLDKDITLHTTDSKTIAEVVLARPKGKNKARAILPTTFCEQLIRLCPAGGFLDIQQDLVCAENADGVFIWARLVEPATKPFDFVGAIARHDKFPYGSSFEIPSRLSLALDRALTMLEGLPDEPVRITVDAGKLRLEVVAEGRGELKDSVDIPDTVPDVSFKIAPHLIKRAMGIATDIQMSDRVVYMSNGDGFSYLASAVGGT